MKKYKLLYFVSEDEYFLSHKIFQAKDALKNKFDVMIICNFTKYENKIKSEGFKTQNINFDRKSINPLNNLNCLIKIIKNYSYLQTKYNSVFCFKTNFINFNGSFF